MNVFEFLLQLGFWQWCGVIVLSSVVFPCIAYSFVAVFSSINFKVKK